jgi:hypothetical protein
MCAVRKFVAAARMSSAFGRQPIESGPHRQQRPAFSDRDEQARRYAHPVNPAESSTTVSTTTQS